MEIINTFILWLTMHTHVAYVVLFFGSYFETLIGPSFFIPGEIFLLSGSVLAGTKVLKIGFVIFALYAGGILGDSSSYLIGRKFGASLFKEGRLVLNPKNYQKGEEFFQKYGLKSIFLARLLGPISWITPFLAGTYSVPYKMFLKYNLPGIFVGIGQFIIVGYFFGSNYAVILKVVEKYTLAVILSGLVIYIIIRFIKKKRMINQI